MDDLSLSLVGQALIGPEGRLYVSQPMDQNIRVYDRHGRLVRTIGRKGRGPGELEGLTSIGGAGDTPFAVEPGRLSLYSAEGEFRGSSPLPQAVVRGANGMFFFPGAPQDLVLLPGGSALVRPGVVALADPPEPGVTTTDSRMPLLRLDERLSTLDTVVFEERTGTSVGLAMGGTVFQFLSPFDDSPLFEIMPDGSGIVIVDREAAPDRGRSSFRVTLGGPSCDTIFSASYAYDPVPTRDEWVLSRVGEISVSPADRPNRPSIAQMARELRAAGLVPETLPPVTAVVGTQDGSIWLRREDDGAGEVVWQVIGPDGSMRGAVRLPVAQTVLAAAGDVLVTLELDELDVPYIVRYRVTR